MKPDPSRRDAPAIVWLRRNLRLADNPALAAAVASGRPLLPVFVLPTTGRPAGGASRWWLHGSLERLAAALGQAGGRLVLRRGEPAVVLDEIARSAAASAVYYNRDWEPHGRQDEARVERALAPSVAVHACPGDALHEPGSIRTGNGSPFQVFTPFWRACLLGPEPATPSPAPQRLAAFAGEVASDSLADWSLRPEQPDWAAGLRARWEPGEAAANHALDEFVDTRLGGYARGRDSPGAGATSALSPRLHFGEIGPRQAWHAVRARLAGDSRLGAGSEAFLRELGWREFSLHLLHAAPDLAVAPLRAEFARFPWRRDPQALRRWQRGQTGYPFVDAGMRELWATGWMHNRVRMVAASFLVKHLLLDWREGEAWFWDTLVDADHAANAASWQWVAGCGTDAAPFFRVFNPFLQGRKFDPDGVYVRRWVPELSRLPAAHLHAPWMAPPPVLAEAGVAIGKDYPAPIVDHGLARQRALEAWSGLRRG